MNTKKITLGIFTILSIALFAGSVQAVFLACFQQGDFIDFCNPAVPDRTAPTDFYFLCMTEYIESGNCYVHASFNSCNDIPPGDGSCNSGSGGNSSIDATPPELTMNTPNPNNSSVFDRATVLLDFHINERSDVFYMDLLDGRNRMIRICNDCSAGTHTKNIRYDEGRNEIRFRATDVVGNIVEHDITFYIDSKDPQISKTEPTRGFSDGNFYVEFSEDNPVNLTLTYGNSFVDQQVDLNTCFEPRTGRKACNVQADVTPWDGGVISYWFTLTDIAGNQKVSRITELSVDATDPIINSLDYTVDGRNAHVDLSVTELNFDVAEYLDRNDDRARWKTFCSRLDDLGECSKRLSFSDGLHDLVINVTDEAGNYDYQEISFYTDSKAPRISSTEPRRGFADGMFYAEIDESNLVNAYLNYGNDVVGYRSQHVDPETCSEARRGVECLADVDVSDYHGMEIEYWFNATDILEQTGESRRTTLEVDTVFPVINSIDYTIDGRRVEFVLDITEDNFDAAEYIDNSASRPRWRSLCSRLSDGICEKRLTFSDGPHDIDIQVTDEAGNAVGQSISLDIV